MRADFVNSTLVPLTIYTLQAISDTVQVVMGFLESTPTKADKVELITTLRTVTEGKVSFF